MQQYAYFVLFCLNFLDVSFIFCNAASAHIYTHQYKESFGHERAEDGAFSPRSSNHYINGEHHQEFDHEVILGMYIV